MKGKIIEHEGLICRATIFSGDGKRYDEIREAHDPIRVGSMLLEVIAQNVTQETPVEQPVDPL